ncbi:TPA: peroxidase [Candidatus Acetothermia bacterium]|nr:peroxidase [Candidatus Acetothermia bacterium]HAZ30589.1 peroxidase [Candidatus Acetothermia bacterium]
MAWIRVVDEADADGDLRACYSRIRSARGKVANIMKVHSLHPAAMEAHLDLYRTILFGPSGLSRQEGELLATAVSAFNGCAYCVRHHAAALRAHVKDEDLVAAIVSNPGTAPLGTRERAMVSYARTLTLTPDKTTEADVTRLREAGFADEEILSIALIVGYFNFVNRIALGLGVQATDGEVAGYRY